MTRQSEYCECSVTSSHTFLPNVVGGACQLSLCYHMTRVDVLYRGGGGGGGTGWHARSTCRPTV